MLRSDLAGFQRPVGPGIDRRPDLVMLIQRDELSAKARLQSMR
jgi:hypothetical protein